MIARPKQNYHGIAVTAPTTVPYARYSEQSTQNWLARALRGALEQADLKTSDLDGVFVSSFTLAPDNAVGLAEHLGLTLRHLDNIAMGGASGVAALQRAARAVQAGDINIAACIAGDRHQRGDFHKLIANFSRFSRENVYPYGQGGPNSCFALITDYYINQYGTTAEQFGHLCIAQRRNAQRNPHALLRTPLDMATYLAARTIATPLRLYDCVMPCAGAEAFLVMSIDEAERRGLPYAQISAVIERHNAFADDPIQWRGGWAQDRAALWDQAGCGPDAMDFVQTYDDYPVISVMQFEDLGFCHKGDGAAFLSGHDLTVTGTLPHNSSGGQLSVGQAGAAGGFLGLVEAVRQLTGQAGPTQITAAKRGLVSGFGMINYDRGVCATAAILTAAGL